MAILLGRYPTTAGTAASLAGTMRFGLGSSAGFMILLLPEGTIVPMVGIMASCTLLSSLSYWILARSS